MQEGCPGMLFTAARSQAKPARAKPEPAGQRAGFCAAPRRALFLTALGIELFKTPNHFAFGGTSGLSIVLAAVFPNLPVSAFMWILNMALVVLGFAFLGVRSMGWTIYSSASFFVSLCEALAVGAADKRVSRTLLCLIARHRQRDRVQHRHRGDRHCGDDQHNTSLEVGRALMLSGLGGWRRHRVRPAGGAVQHPWHDPQIDRCGQRH